MTAHKEHLERPQDRNQYIHEKWSSCLHLDVQTRNTYLITAQQYDSALEIGCFPSKTIIRYNFERPKHLKPDALYHPLHIWFYYHFC